MRYSAKGLLTVDDDDERCFEVALGGELGS